jgi:hypothetical protein
LSHLDNRAVWLSEQISRKIQALARRKN